MQIMGQQRKTCVYSRITGDADGLITRKVSRRDTMGNRGDKIIKVAGKDNFPKRMSPLLKDKYSEIKRKIDLQQGKHQGNLEEPDKINILKLPSGKS